MMAAGYSRSRKHSRVTSSCDKTVIKTALCNCNNGTSANTSTNNSSNSNGTSTHSNIKRAAVVLQVNVTKSEVKATVRNRYYKQFFVCNEGFVLGIYSDTA